MVAKFQKGSNSACGTYDTPCPMWVHMRVQLTSESYSRPNIVTNSKGIQKFLA